MEQTEESLRAPQITELKKESFQEEVLQAKVPVIVYLHDPDHPTCKEQLPVVNEAAQTLAGQVKFVLLNTSSRDTNSESGPYPPPSFILEDRPARGLVEEEGMPFLGTDFFKGPLNKSELQDQVMQRLNQLQNTMT